MKLLHNMKMRWILLLVLMLSAAAVLLPSAAAAAGDTDTQKITGAGWQGEVTNLTNTTIKVDPEFKMKHN